MKQYDHMKRLFVAINLPAGIKIALGKIQDKFKELNKYLDAKWVDSEIIHLTIHFFGDTPEEKIGLISDIITKASRGVGTINFELGDLGCFPNSQEPKIIWLGLREVDNNNLQKLHKQLRNELIKNKFEVDYRPFQPHLTLGRFRLTQTCQGLDIPVPKTQFSVNNICLMESELKPDGPEHNCLKIFPLKSPLKNPSHPPLNRGGVSRNSPPVKGEREGVL